MISDSVTRIVIKIRDGDNRSNYGRYEVNNRSYTRKYQEMVRVSQKKMDDY